ncbi:cell division control protein [Plectosphaerella plurivora]|uniref:Cell division control protein n=1 Tax=Plectosphaerella plurivora TaxID=936078 RepID=A0A9P9A9W8_9PEZI|nr:cell division control protein [Plectosphaerella plurivora]
MAAAEQDPLLLLRQSVTSKRPAIPSSSADTPPTEASLSKATHLHFSDVSVPLDTPTRFISSDQPVDLRSIYFAWLNKDVAIPEYNASATRLNEELAGLGKVQNLAFVERLDLFTWLEGASEESEHIRPLAGEGRDAAGAASAVKAVPSAAVGRSGRGTLDPRLALVYNGERKMGDRNTVLRGSKLVVCADQRQGHLNRLADNFSGLFRRAQARSTFYPEKKPPSRRPDPIILLSPSASSILRLSNIRSFLENGRYMPPDSGSASSSMLHVSRVLKDVDPSRPTRFILVEGPEQFKPEYWDRVAAVFTTGQTWQFKNYKWSDPNELFRRVQGIFVGWRGELPPQNIQDWGHRVMQLGVDRPRGQMGVGPAADAARFRDKEVVEAIWKQIEAGMKAKGWTKTSAPAAL